MKDDNLMQLADECSAASDKINNLLTAIQLRAGLLKRDDEDVQYNARIILQVAAEAAECSARLQRISTEYHSGTGDLSDNCSLTRIAPPE